MWHSVRSGWRATVVVVAAWRAFSELLARARELRASGVLDRRIAQRRQARIDRALAAWRVSPVRARDRARTRVRVPVAIGRSDQAPTAGGGIDRAVHVGAAPVEDLDDIGLLEAAMRRAVRDRRAEASRPADAIDWGGLIEARADAPDHDRARVPAWVVPGAFVGVVLTIVPLVRPLADAAPWLAVAGLALVAAAAIGAYRR